MTNQQILEKAVKQAQQNGYPYKDITVGYPDIKIGPNVFAFREIIFNHDFAKALWGKDGYCYVNYEYSNDYEKLGPNSGSGNFAKLEWWQYHLQQMVIADDPIKYLGENI